MGSAAYGGAGQDTAVDVHTRGTSGDFSALLQTLDLATSVGLRLADHVVVVEGLASRADEERGA